MNAATVSAAEFSAMALDVYADKGKGTRVYSWTRQNFLGDPQNGFFAAAYQTPRTKKLVVAFRGTQFESLVDWKNNALNTVGLASFNWDGQLNTALAYFRSVRSIYASSECAVCGHSLGGFLASMVAIREGVLGVTFNPAPLGASGAPQLMQTMLGRKSARLVNFRLKGDVVSGMRTFNLGKVIELQHNKLELLVRAARPGWQELASDLRQLNVGKVTGAALGDLDPLMHSMALMHEAVLGDTRSALAPESWT